MRLFQKSKMWTLILKPFSFRRDSRMQISPADKNLFKLNNIKIKWISKDIVLVSFLLTLSKFIVSLGSFKRSKITSTWHFQQNLVSKFEQVYSSLKTDRKLNIHIPLLWDNFVDHSLSYSLSSFAKYNGNYMKKWQKQPSRGVLKKRCSEDMQQIYRRIPIPKCHFNNGA